jgi:hypothetical protein
MAMLLNDVVMGKTIKLTITDQSLTRVRTASEFVENVPRTVFGTYTAASRIRLCGR